MGIRSPDLKQYVIEPTLAKLGETRPLAATLLQVTGAFESDTATTLKSSRNFGLYGIDKVLHRQVWDTWLVKDPELASRVRGLASQSEFLCAPHQELITNLAYATAIAWCCYRMNDVKLPDTEDPIALTQCWQRYFRPAASTQALTIFANTCQGLLGQRSQSHDFQNKALLGKPAKAA